MTEIADKRLHELYGDIRKAGYKYALEQAFILALNDRLHDLELLGSACDKLHQWSKEVAQLNERLTAAEKMAEAILQAQFAMRHPIDAWKEEVERSALDRCSEALARFRSAQPEQQPKEQTHG